MTTHGSIDTAAAAKLPTVTGTPIFLERPAGHERSDLPERELDARRSLIGAAGPIGTCRIEIS